MKSHRPTSIPLESRDQPKRPIPPPPLRGGTWDVGQAGGPLTVRCAICRTRLSHRLVATLADLLGAGPLTAEAAV